MKLAYGKKAAIVFVLVALLSVAFWAFVIYWLSRPVPPPEDVLLARALSFARKSDEGLAFDREALRLLESVVRYFPRSRQAQIALMEKARFEARHGMLRDARTDYGRIRKLWPNLYIAVQAQVEEAMLLERKFGDRDVAAAIREILFSRMLFEKDRPESAGAPTAAPLRRRETVLAISMDLADYYCRKRQWKKAADVMERLLAAFRYIQLWDQITVRLAELYQERLADRERAITLYRKVAAAPTSPWANFALERLSELGESP